MKQRFYIYIQGVVSKGPSHGVYIYITEHRKRRPSIKYRKEKKGMRSNQIWRAGGHREAEQNTYIQINQIIPKFCNSIPGPQIILVHVAHAAIEHGKTIMVLMMSTLI